MHIYIFNNIMIQFNLKEQFVPSTLLDFYTLPVAHHIAVRLQLKSLAFLEASTSVPGTKQKHYKE